MISQRKLDANRLNAKKSTGPVTSRGKFISSRNALKTGKYAKVHHLAAAEEIERTPTLLEAQAEIAELTKDFTRTFEPVAPEQRRYIKTLATAEWSIRQFESIFDLAVVALVKSAQSAHGRCARKVTNARARALNPPPLVPLVPRRQVAMRGTFIDEALPPAA